MGAWGTACKTNCDQYTLLVARAGLVIGHTGHFPGGLTHLRGRQNVFFDIRDSEQPVAHWFVSCIDSANHPITKRYRRIDEVFCSAYTQRSLHPNFFLVGSSHVSQQLYQEQACSAVSDAGQRARQEEERRVVESVKCLIGTRNGGRHLTYTNVCACHK